MSEAAPAPSSGRCVYGYALCLISITSLIIYLIWAFVPSHYLNQIGLTYLPSKYWALAIPTLICFLIFMFATIIYHAIIFMFTPSLASVNTLADSYSKNVKFNINRVGIPQISDLTIDFVCEKLYSK